MNVFAYRYFPDMYLHVSIMADDGLVVKVVKVINILMG